MTSEATKTTEKVETKAKEQPKKLYGRGKARVQKGLVYAAAVITFAVLLFFAAAGGLLLGVSLVTRSLSPWIAYPAVYAAVLILGFFAAWLLNVYVCPHAHCAKKVALGSFLTALAWLAASGAFSVYLMFGNKEKLYGALALVIVFLLWLYWLMICFVAGVIFNKHRAKPPRSV